MGRNRKPIRVQDLTPQETYPFVDRVMHVWCRGIDDLHVFPSDYDKRVFMEIFDRHLGPDIVRDKRRRPYEKLNDDVELLAFNILDNHYHLVILQKRPGGLLRFMRSLLAAYGRHFNDSHGRRAQIFESPYSVRLAVSRNDVRELIGYVHANHELLGLRYEFSSHLEYVGARGNRVVACDLGMKLFAGPGAYVREMELRVERTRRMKAEKRELWVPSGARRLKHGVASHIPPNVTTKVKPRG